MLYFKSEHEMEVDDFLHDHSDHTSRAGVTREASSLES